MKIMKWINTAAFLVMAAVNLLAELLPLGGKTTAEISAGYPSLFTPAGMTFSIWGVIYILLGLYVVFQWEFFKSAENNAAVKETGGLFALSCVINTLWIICWHSGKIGSSVLLITVLLVTLMLIQYSLKGIPAGTFQRITVNLGFDIYYGWIIAAMIANISAWLVSVGWNGFGLSETFWASTMLIVGAIIGICVVTAGKNRIAGAAVIWAYIGILTKHISADGFGGKYAPVISAAVIGIVCILTAIVMTVMFPSSRAEEEAK